MCMKLAISFPPPLFLSLFLLSLLCPPSLLLLLSFSFLFSLSSFLSSIYWLNYFSLTNRTLGPLFQLYLILSNFPATDRTLDHNFPSQWGWKEWILLLWQTPVVTIRRAKHKGWWHRPGIWITDSFHTLLLALGHSCQQALPLRSDRHLTSDIWLSWPCGSCSFFTAEQEDKIFTSPFPILKLLVSIAFFIHRERKDFCRLYWRTEVPSCFWPNTLKKKN